MGDEASLTDIADSEALQVQEPMILTSEHCLGPCVNHREYQNKLSET
jgi:hypothetical protein